MIVAGVHRNYTASIYTLLQLNFICEIPYGKAVGRETKYVVCPQLIQYTVD